MSKILIVDDNIELRKNLEEALVSEGYKVTGCGSASEALRMINQDNFELIVTDIVLPIVEGKKVDPNKDRENGLEVIVGAKKKDPSVLVIAITAYATEIDDVVRAMRMGAWNYIKKPFSENELILRVYQAFEEQEREKEKQRLLEENLQLKAEVEKQYGEIVGQSEVMQKVFKIIHRAANSPFPVLIIGENGTGKELVARAIHSNSSRKDKPFVGESLTSIPNTLIHSTLFGHEKGSFTGATSNRDGAFKRADGSTLFLDEIGYMPLELQKALLRVLQEQEITPLGSNKPPIKVDVKVVAATDQDLKKALAEGTFLKQLYHRLNVLSIYLPPLRERREDIPLLVEHFLQEIGKDLGREREFAISPKALALMMHYDWPGNVRELKNILSRAVTYMEGTKIELQDLYDWAPELQEKPKNQEPVIENILLPIETKDISDDYDSKLQEMERNMILTALEMNDWNESQTARYLKIDRSKLRRKREKLGIQISSLQGA